MTELATIKDVPLLRVGTFNASTGEFSADRAMLAAIVRAWESGYTNDPVLKLGHQGHKASDDSGRAYGQVTNLRIAEGGDVLLGDYVNVPKTLADELPSAYPYRSVELAINVTRRDEAGEVLDTYDAVLTALALLGDTEPAVAGLGVTPAVAASGMKSGMEVESTAVVLAALPGGRSANYLRDALARAIGVDVLDFTDTDVFFTSTTSETSVVGQRYTVHESTGEIVLDGDPYPVETNALYGGSTPVGSPAVTPEEQTAIPAANVPHSTAAALEDGSITTKEGTMENIAALLTEEQMTALAVDVNTPDEEVFSALIEYAFAPRDDADGQPNADAALAAGEARVSASVFAGMQTRIAELEANEAARVEAARTQRVDAALSAAINEGRIGQDEEAHWRASFEANEEATAAILASRTPAFNTTETGFVAASAQMTPDDVNAAFDEFMANDLKITTRQEG